jgi:hypothetical protein
MTRPSFHLPGPGLALQPYEVEVAPELPARQFHIQPGLEEQHAFSGLEFAGLGLQLVRELVVVLEDHAQQVAGVPQANREKALPGLLNNR